MAVAIVVYKLCTVAYKELTSPIRALPGPKSGSWFFGSIREAFDGPPSASEWVNVYGTTFQFKGPFNFARLWTIDPKAQSHVLMRNDIYERPMPAREALSRIVGPGVLVTEGEMHRKQLRDLWASEANRQGGTGRIDVLSWLSRMTLDVIGLAGFNYTFDALNENATPNELNQAFSTIFHSGTNNRTIMVLRVISPVFRYLRTSRDAVAEQAQVVMGRIGRELLNSSKAAVAQSEKEIGDRSLRSRNLLSLLVRANTAAGIPESHRLQDEDVLAQIPTFLVAGHETTSTATTWALFALAQESVMQTKLREELCSVETDTPTMDELNALPYLDRVVRETLRVHSPVPAIGRVATVDDEIPLSQPVTDVYGNIHHSIRIQKGQNVMIPISALNLYKPIWGEDAEQFKPDRWLSPPQASSAIPGVWSNQMTFLGGPRACIGYRFSLVEMKALLFVLIRSFTFELAVPASEIIKKASIVQRPLLKSNPEAGNVLPMLIKPYTRV
ncbi:hypothetical protein PLEOSDRAFT_1046114 [Pleurotus ostreatus PC15]|uniref:Cytochrome P450 n=1 Tax=Pleurotus ostreatus (strain PC15) TaxID=1137138 RepID=A0A067ND82_PLEO1|nr:hypothetical protein PLEOSDRAFT_1046114 [Pleurotus ostreatus PC15]